MRTPQGMSSSGDAYTRRYDEIIADVPRKVKIVDDSLLHDNSISGSFYHTFEYLKLCENSNITLKKAKFQFCEKNVDFAGFHLGWNHFSPSSNTLAAIKDFPMPEEPTITDIRAWFGLVNQLCPFLLTSQLMKPFQELLKSQQNKGKHRYWDDELQSIFNKSKIDICNQASKGLSYFNTKRKIITMTDWSQNGIGFVVLQQKCSCVSDFPCCPDGWTLVLCGSRRLTTSEKNYAPIEGGALALTWCLKKARMLLHGCPLFIAITDIF